MIDSLSSALGFLVLALLAVGLVWKLRGPFPSRQQPKGPAWVAPKRKLPHAPAVAPANAREDEP